MSPVVAKQRRTPFASILKAARAQGATRVQTPDGYTVDLAPITNEDSGDDIDRLLERHKRKTTNGSAQKKTGL